MKKSNKEKLKSFLELLLVVILFIIASYLVQNNLGALQSLIGMGLLSMILYVAIVIVAIVIAPVSAMPLLPIASNLWGASPAAILSIIGWTIGALIAFVIARKYGVPIVKKLVPIRKINHYESLVPKTNIFWSIVFLRMVIPVDILSYALGLFSRIGWKRYSLATLIGVAPFAFVFAYVGRMPVTYQVIALAASLLIFLAGATISRKKISRKGHKIFK